MEEKLKHILSGALLCNLMPILGALLWVLGLGFLVDLYSWPLGLIDNIFGVKLSLLSVTIPFWSVVGGIAGYLVYLARRKMVRKF